VRCYIRFRLPYAHVVELLAERGVQVVRSSVFDWIRSFAYRYMEACVGCKVHPSVVTPRDVSY